jgi:ATP-dependent exoDNAse (exonuclease V) beta subunit
MSDDLLQQDAAARRRALEPVSFIVEAPAGAGKTELLSQRFLRLMASVDDPEEVVAITFTNKAAAEMRQRILESLEVAQRGVRPEAPHKQVTFDLARAVLATAASRGWQLLDHPGRLRVITIDAFCAGLARQMPLLSRLGSQPRLAEDAGRHYREAAQRALAWLDAEGPLADVVAVALQRLDNDSERLVDLLAAMLARRDQWLRHAVAGHDRQAAEAGLAALVAKDLAAVARHIDDTVQQQLMPLARFAAANLPAEHALSRLGEWQRPLGADVADLPGWQALAWLLLTDNDTPRRALNKNQGFPAKVSRAEQDALLALAAGLSRAALAALVRVRSLPAPFYDDDEWRTVEALGALLKVAAAELWNVFHEAGEVDFTELSQRALLALGSDDAPTDLALALDYRIRHLLVDEFQDTSPAQVELLRRLTAGWSPGDGRSLFLVGDPMQSIYRFRKADVGLFLQVAKHGLGALPLENLALHRNNRSCPAVVDWINTAFDAVFPAADDVPAGAISYRPFVAAKAALPDAGVVCHPIAVSRAGDPEGPEAACMLDIIDAERAAGRRVAVLVRARDHLAPLVAAIRRARPDLRFRAVEVEGLAERQSVQDLFALTLALHQRADRLNWLAILRAPWCGLTLADLHQLAAEQPTATIWSLMQDEERLAGLSEDGRRRLLHVRTALAAALAHQGRLPVRRWIETTWWRLGGPACMSGQADMADALAFLDLLEELDSRREFVPERLAGEVARLYAAPDAGADDGLQLMTLHKAKGLEFDCVILPGLNRVTGGGMPALMRWEEVAHEDGGESLVVAPVRRRRGADAGDVSVFEWLGQLEREREANEAARVLYVGATRAVQRLHLVAAVVRNSAGELQPRSGSFLAMLWPKLAAAFVDIADADLPGGAVPAGAPPLRRVAEPFVAAGSQGIAAAGDVAVMEAVDPYAADIGTLVHAYLEMIAGDGMAAWPVTRIEALRPAMASWLTRRGHDDKAAAAAADRTCRHLTMVLGSEDGHWLLQAREGAAAELALARAEEDGSSLHVVDRSFVSDGRRWIIDYKTAEPAGDLAAHAEHYRPQLERYASLFAGEGLPVSLAVFYTAYGRLIVLA